MKNKFFNHIIIISFIGIVATGCGSKSGESETSGIDTVRETVRIYDPLEETLSEGKGQNLRIEQPVNRGRSGINDREILRDLIYLWNEGLNMRDAEMSGSILAPKVFYYTKELPRNEVVSHKIKKFTANPSWVQEIVSEISFEENNDGTITTYFTKTMHSDQGSNDYVQYLVWKEIGGEWKLIRESDTTTDRNVRKHKE